jgi:hypothetical protein
MEAWIGLLVYGGLGALIATEPYLRPDHLERDHGSRLLADLFGADNARRLQLYLGTATALYGVAFALLALG